jgi:primosomal protein N' (replication factor Y)
MELIAVAVNTPQHSGLGDVLTYRATSAAAPGTLVRVPLGRRETTGIVWARCVAAPPADQLRDVIEAIGALPALPASWLQLVEFAAAYYQRSIGEVALGALPPSLLGLDNRQMERRVARAAKGSARAGHAAPGRGDALAAVRAAVETPAGDPNDPGLAQPPLPELSAEQQAALAALAEAHGRPLLVHGVTGSGKTEIYLRAVARALEAGRQALMLVPEINLTPQLEALVAARFPLRRVVSLHSALGAAERARNWLAVLTGRAEIVLGTRLAVFAPLVRPGLIVVDEEHDPSFKQQEGARYSARDLAVYRGRLEGVPVLLGSATPSLESWQHAQSGRYALISLNERVGGGPMPRLRIVDLRNLPRGGTEREVLVPALREAIAERVGRREQSLLLLNRRGWAPVLHCAACGWKSGCAHCSAWRVFHKSDRTLRCHHCGFTERVPRACPDCGNLDLAAIGRGTERLEEQLRSLLPQARVARIDADTTRRAGALQAQLAEVHAGEVDVLVGTQMIAKGHDFRRVTLVAAVNPDAMLFSADFRSGERLFALLMQAAGRAGREASQAAASEMWLQTGYPDHPLYRALARHDYPGFAMRLLDERRTSGLPPFMHLALLRADAARAADAEAFLQRSAAAAAALSEAAGVTVYPPVPAAMARIADVERMQMLVESASRPALQRFLAAWAPALIEARAATRGLERFAVDVDPLSF